MPHEIVKTVTVEQMSYLASVHRNLINNPLFFDCSGEDMFVYILIILSLHLIADCPEHLIKDTIDEIPNIMPRLYRDLQKFVIVEETTIM